MARDKQKPLTDTEISRLKPDWLDRPRKYYDTTRGLHLLMSPRSQRKTWRYRYQLQKREYLVTIGYYRPNQPDHMSLASARAEATRLAAAIERGGHPAAERAAPSPAEPVTFKKAADDYIARSSAPHRKESTVRRDKLLLAYCSSVASKPIGDVKATELQTILDGGPRSGEYKKRMRQFMGRVFDHAMNQEWCARNPTPKPVFVEKTTQGRRPAIIDPKAFGELLRKIDGYQGHMTVTAALKLMPLVALRPAELRLAQWGEIDFESNLWTIPAERMKGGKREHLVPLSTQAASILWQLHLFTDDGDNSFVFRSHLLRDKQPFSDKALNSALRRLGVDTVNGHTGHGFRSSFSTIANENGQNSDLVEMTLAHAGGDKIKRLYDRSTLIAKRRELLQWWADHCDALKQAQPRDQA